MARRRASHRLARWHRGHPAAHGGHSPPLHTNPHRDIPLRGTNYHHRGTGDNAHHVADDTRSAAAAHYDATGKSDLVADHAHHDPHPHRDPNRDSHLHLDPNRDSHLYLDPNPDSHPDAQGSAVNDGPPGAAHSHSDRHPDSSADSGEHPDSSADPGEHPGAAAGTG